MSAVAAAAPEARTLRAPRSALIALAITLLAGALRLYSLGGVAPDPFYDAAVRSMGTSLHAFLLGAFEPSGSVSIDKPPVDLWLQVASTKLLGFNGTALRLPEAIASTLTVPLLYSAVRRALGTTAGLAAALCLALLPVAIVTGRSDTMDGVMGLLLVAGLWCLVRTTTTGRARWIYALAACIGVAFNVKLFEAFVPLPALAVGAWLALRAMDLPMRRRLLHLAGAAAVLVAVSLSWLTGTLFASHPPFAIGSTNGSAWNAAFVFNGWDRIATPAREPVKLVPRRKAHHTASTHTVHKKAKHKKAVHVHITGPGPARLLGRAGPLPVARLGLLVLAALVLGLPALVVARRRGPATNAIAVTLGLWVVSGAVFFSAMARLHPRYVESMTAAVAAAGGAGVAWLAGRAGAGRGAVPAGILVALAAYAVWAARGSTAAWLGLLAALGVAVAVFAPRARSGHGTPPTALLAVLATFALVGAPAADAVHVVRANLSDAGHPGAMPGPRVHRLSTFLRSHRHGARYEFGAAAATQAGELVARDGQPVLVLTSFNGRPLVSVSRLARLVAAADVRYIMLGGTCATHVKTLAVCSPAALWVRSHGTDISRAAGVYRGLLWQVGPQGGSTAPPWEVASWPWMGLR